MANSWFRFKQFIIQQDKTAMKVTTDTCLFGAWVADAIQHDNHQPASILDIGAGNGLLSLMVAQKNKQPIDAIEIDEAAAQQAAENTLASPWKDSITIVNEDVLQWQPGKKWDCIIANPPFYESDLKSDNEGKNKAHHGDGLRLYSLFQFIKKHLGADGLFFILLPVKRTKAIELLFKEFDFHLNKKITVKQTTQHPPFRLMLQGSLIPAAAIEQKDIAIKNDEGQYTHEFALLLKDYYLYL